MESKSEVAIGLRRSPGEALTAALPLRRGLIGDKASLGIGVKAYQGGDIEVIMLDSNNNEIRHETISAENDYMASLGYGERIGNVNLGLALKYIHSTLVEDYSASAVAVDAGTIYNTPIEGLSVGLSLLNIGSEMICVSENNSG